MIREPVVEVICSDAALARGYVRELERNGELCRFRVSTFAPAVCGSGDQGGLRVFLLDESGIAPSEERAPVEHAAARFVSAGPVVVVAAATRQLELAHLIESGAVDFVVRRGDFITSATETVARRLYKAESGNLKRLSGNGNSAFGEMLRHEVNNPLTGILGNAELLLARRSQLPPAVVERVETIAELAVRLRETIRRLSST
jgi:signal transduction histidine kinase